MREQGRPKPSAAEPSRPVGPAPSPPGADGYFDHAAAARYDEMEGPMFDPSLIAATVDVLKALGDGGRALEFGIGTGRIALPLAAEGVEVAGIELSRPMIARLREKDGGADVTVTQGDFSQVRVGGSFTLVYLVFNTIMNLTTQEGQQACFRNAAEHLDIGGVFVIEVMIPALRLLPPGQTSHVFDISDDHIGIDEYDVANQGLISHHFHLEPGQEPNRASVPFRYVWPAELDLMAEMAGMRLRHRWENWDRDPFTSDSPGHVSVWERIA